NDDHLASVNAARQRGLQRRSVKEVQAAPGFGAVATVEGHRLAVGLDVTDASASVPPPRLRTRFCPSRPPPAPRPNPHCNESRFARVDPSRRLALSSATSREVPLRKRVRARVRQPRVLARIQLTDGLSSDQSSSRDGAGGLFRL